MSHPIVTVARGWIGTRFHHQGRLKKTGNHKGGVDCLGLLVGVAAELDLRDAHGKPLTLFDENDYPHQPDTEYLRKKLAEMLAPIIPPPVGGGPGGGQNWQCLTNSCPHPNPNGEGILYPGDIVLLRIDESPQHLAIVSDFSDGLGLIHAYAPARAVVEHALDGWWMEKIEAAFRVR